MVDLCCNHRNATCHGPGTSLMADLFCTFWKALKFYKEFLSIYADMNFDTIPCAFKKRIELKASEELRVISEQCACKDSGRKNEGSFTETHNVVLQESNEDLGSLMHRMLVTEKENIHSVAFKTPLSAWQICHFAKHHKGGYQIEPEVATKRISTCGKNEHVFTLPRCHRNLSITKENMDEKSHIERDMVKDARAKSVSYIDDQANRNARDGGKIYNLARTRSASPSPQPGYTFNHSKSTTHYIKSYREQITNDFIRKHIQWRLKENCRSNVKKSPKRTNETKRKALLPAPSFTFYRFRMSKTKNPCDSGYLKVGPCPRMSEQKEHKRMGVKSYNTATSSEQRKTHAKSVSTTAVQKADRKETNSVTTLLKFQNTAPTTQPDDIVRSVNSEANTKDANKTESRESDLKKVELRVNSRIKDLPRIVPKTVGRANKTKGRVLGAFPKPTLKYCKSSSEISRLTRKPTFGEKEFLRITTPKPLIRYQSQTPSDFDELLGFSPNKSSEISPSLSPVPSLSGTGLRSQVIAEILMKREPQVVFPKNSKFQACITPSNYSTSSVETHLRNRKDISPIDSCQNGAEDKSESELSQLRRMPSKPSIPRIGPFISG